MNKHEELRAQIASKRVPAKPFCLRSPMAEVLRNCRVETELKLSIVEAEEEFS